MIEFNYDFIVREKYAVQFFVNLLNLRTIANDIDSRLHKTVLRHFMSNWMPICSYTYSNIQTFCTSILIVNMIRGHP